MTATLHDLLKSYREGGVFPSYDQLAAIAGQDQGGAAVRGNVRSGCPCEPLGLDGAVCPDPKTGLPLCSSADCYSAKPVAAVRGEAVVDDLLKTWPDEIWLQGDEEILGEFQGESETVTWCSSQQYGGDVRYIRADLASHVSARAADAPSEPSERSFHVVVDEDEEPVFVAKLRKSAQEHINDACDVDVESAGKWKSIPVFEKQLGNQSKPAAWIDQFGNVFPLGAYQPSGKPSYLDADKRGWKPLFRAADALDSQPTGLPVLYATHVENIELALAQELDEAALSANDYVTVNREKLRGIAERILAAAKLELSSQPTDGGVRNG